jgi:hypothetical protein
VDTYRLRVEVAEAQMQFSNVELRLTTQSVPYAKVALQTSVGSVYVLSVFFDGYPSRMPQVFVDAPALQAPPHRYKDRHICYMHPSMWNPGLHDLTFVIARAAKWLNKYEVWKRTGNWPGAEIQH